MVNERRGWSMVFAFLAGALIADLGFAPADFLFFQRLQDSSLTPPEQTFFYFVLPAVFSLTIFAFAYAASRTGLFHPVHVLYVFAGLILIGAYKTFQLPAARDTVFLSTIFLSTLVAVGILLGLKQKVEE